MAFSVEWDERYRSDTHVSIWPWTDLVSLVMRHTPIRTESCRVLELGCGAGANIPFFKHMGAQYFALEGSPFIVEKLHERYPDLEQQIVVGDFCQEIPFEGPFDIVIDRASLTQNPEVAIRHCLDMVRDRMSPGGIYIGVDWFGCEHVDFPRGEPVDDDFTRTGYTEGPFAHVGKVHFSDQPHLESLFRDFELLQIDKKILISEKPASGQQQTWNFVARRGDDS